MDDNTLVKQFVSGDKTAFDKLVIRHRDWVKGMALGSLKDPHRAEDIAQNVFVKMYFKLHQFRFEAELKTWIYRIALNELNLFYRKEKMISWFNEDEEEYLIPAVEPNEDEDKKVYGNKIRNLIKKLSKMQRSVMVLRIYQELPFKDIGNILGITENSAKVNFFKAKNNLKKRIKNIEL
jgi:RNA polymerase sigma factor (sigma-70 family)